MKIIVLFNWRIFYLEQFGLEQFHFSSTQAFESVIQWLIEELGTPSWAAPCSWRWEYSSFCIASWPLSTFSKTCRQSNYQANHYSAFWQCRLLIPLSKRWIWLNKSDFTSIRSGSSATSPVVCGLLFNEWSFHLFVQSSSQTVSVDQHNETPLQTPHSLESSLGSAGLGEVAVKLLNKTRKSSKTDWDSIYFNYGIALSTS